jgi:hypothetical protein
MQTYRSIGLHAFNSPPVTRVNHAPETGNNARRQRPVNSERVADSQKFLSDDKLEGCMILKRLGQAAESL